VIVISIDLIDRSIADSAGMIMAGQGAIEVMDKEFENTKS
jgi:hypothetical protein